MRTSTYLLGLTGNIATGKSTVASMLASLGACVIDADRVAHHVMRAGTPANRAIVDHFGRCVQAPDGEIDRGRLGAIVFSDPAALKDLEQIVHPAVVRETLNLLATCSGQVRVIEAIKLLEAHMHDHCDGIWVVTSPRELQIARLTRTRGLALSSAEQRIQAQPPAKDKLPFADVVIDNSGSLEETWRQVLAAWNKIPGLPPACGNTPLMGDQTKDSGS